MNRCQRIQMIFYFFLFLFISYDEILIELNLPLSAVDLHLHLYLVKLSEQPSISEVLNNCIQRYRIISDSDVRRSYCNGEISDLQIMLQIRQQKQFLLLSSVGYLFSSCIIIIVCRATDGSKGKDYIT